MAALLFLVGVGLMLVGWMGWRNPDSQFAVTGELADAGVSSIVVFALGVSFLSVVVLFWVVREGALSALRTWDRQRRPPPPPPL